jgi:hypothetical protein
MKTPFGGIILYIQRLIANFGRLDHSALELSDGLNILEAPNETGKSTWCAFLTAMLYGINSKERDRTGYIAEKNRYAPWNGSAMEGQLDCIAGGQALTVSRTTARPAAPMGVFAARYTGTGDAVASLTGENCGETLLGVPREVYERSALIRQSGLRVTADAELERRIVALITSGGEETSYTEASAALKASLNRRRHNQTGRIPALEAQLSDTLQSLRTAQERQGELTDVSRQLAELTARRESLEQALEQCRRYETAQKCGELQQLKQEADRAAQHAQALRCQLEQERLPDVETIARLRGAIVNLETTRRSVEKARDKRDEALKGRLRAESAVNESIFSGQTAENAKNEVQGALKPQSGMRETLASLPAVLLTALVVVFLANRPGGADPLLCAGIIALGIAVGLLCRGLCLRSSAKAHAAALLKRFGTAEPDRITALADGYANLLTVLELARAEASAASSTADALYTALSSNEQAILLDVRRFAPSVFDAAAADSALRSAAVRRKELTNAERVSREALLRYEALSHGEGSAEERADADYSVELSAPAEDRATLEARTAALGAEIAEAQSRADRLTGQLAAAGDPAALESQAAELERQLDALRREYDALALALEALDSANSVLQTRFSPALGRRAAEIFSDLTDGRYTGVVLDRAFHLSAAPAGNSVYRDAQLLSAGALDQLYLAVRLAICEQVLPPSLSAPIVLDDALATFDDDRCASALRWLRRESEQRQILLFTCHSREAAFFRDDSAVSIRRLTNPPVRV